MPWRPISTKTACLPALRVCVYSLSLSLTLFSLLRTSYSSPSSRLENFYSKLGAFFSFLVFLLSEAKCLESLFLLSFALFYFDFFRTFIFLFAMHCKDFGATLKGVICNFKTELHFFYWYLPLIFSVNFAYELVNNWKWIG